MAETAQKSEKAQKQEIKGAECQKNDSEQKNNACETQEAKTKELTETLQRLQAEFENYQKRSLKQNQEFMTFANAKLMEELLPVLDTLDSAMTHNKEFVLVHEQLFSVLRKNGLQKIVAGKGMKFNHDKMECLIQEKDEKLPEGVIVNILMSGYELNGKVLRPVKVSVNNLHESEQANNDAINSSEEKIHEKK